VAICIARTLAERNNIGFIEFPLWEKMKRMNMVELQLIGLAACRTGLALKELLAELWPFG
jgi:hypothetical protein